MLTALVLNSGSSSLKYQLIQMQTERVIASGVIDRIGEKESSLTHRLWKGDTHQVDERKKVTPQVDHLGAFNLMMQACHEYGPSLVENPPDVIGHRVVHGGSRFCEPTMIDRQLVDALAEISDLAPLHNPANVQGILAAQQVFSRIPQVAVFDTAFHQTLSPAAYTYAIDSELATAHQVRRYGFHGTSHKFVAQTAADFLNRPLPELKTIVLHLGNGASACAIEGGLSRETSMGFTPLEGLVMGSRPGDLDPGVVSYVQKKAGFDAAEVDALLNYRSGLMGLTGFGDMRDVLEAIEQGDSFSERAALAFEVYRHRIKHYIGAYFAQLGGLDVLIFTAGVGENSVVVRAGCLDGLHALGIFLDDDLNRSSARGPRIISATHSPVTVLVVPTNEELEIARQALSLLSPQGPIKRR